jgi:hypothetical protein
MCAKTATKIKQSRLQPYAASFAYSLARLLNTLVWRKPQGQCERITPFEMRKTAISG